MFLTVIKWGKLRPVHKVVVLYPEKWGETDVEPIEGRSIGLIPLTSATDLTIFQDTIKRLIEELIAETENEKRSSANGREEVSRWEVES